MSEIVNYPIPTNFEITEIETDCVDVVIKIDKLQSNFAKAAIERLVSFAFR